MDYLFKRFNIILIGAVFVLLGIGAIVLFVNLLPYLIIIGLSIWGIYEVLKFIRGTGSYNVTNTYNFGSFEKMDKTPEDTFDIKDKDVIDVDYKEAK